ncbi:error-prone DNA polymerase [Rhizobium sp. CFBP 8762]|uniref:error-prone DNA polymerase n=1 Tax=Rhizobium sp. CFBP 8762 TaxID=2775279 RepID=UPI00177E8131|nr:error-prone DNA polymerase [Rhizobium sp. CFBP 8762]MBD8556827.1 error-prone DNA polymerase [Rhizobium sp. CFBP 8762]
MTLPPVGPFVELGARSNFSFLEGASHAEEMVEAADTMGLAGIGLADRNTVAGVVRGWLKAKETGTPYQPGARLVFADGTPDILAYPIDRAGWGHLCRLLTVGNLRSTKGECTLFESDLMEWGDRMMLAIMPSPDFTDSDLLGRLKARFKRNIYLALVARYDGNDSYTFAALAELADRANIRLLASNDPFYHAGKRRTLADVIASIREHVPIAKAGFLLQANAERHIKSPKDMAWIFRDYPDAITNTVKFFSRLTFSLKELKHNYPDEGKPDETPNQTLLRLTYEGARIRYKNGLPDEVRKTITKEMALITEKEYEPYFLTVHHIVEYARGKGILCQGRGSAANSVICYCLGITEVAPELSGGLLFERFLSTEREEPPDIDVDFEHERREEVIQYIYEHYGRHRTGLAAAVTTYRPRSAGREIAKAFGMSEDVQSALSSAVWGWWTESLSENEAKQAGLDTADPATRMLLDHAKQLIRFPRHLSQHSGGFVITNDRLDEVVPIMNTAMKDRQMVEWDKNDLDAVGLLKIDILALGMLTCLAKSFALLLQHYNLELDLRSMKDRQSDDVYDMICRADTLGVFQIESRAQMSMLPRLRPRVFYDLVIEVAIVRPGPIQGNMVHPYLKRREDVRAGRTINYEKPQLEKILKRTLGIPLFQEQAMQIAIEAGGFSPSEADKLRRSMATFQRTGQVKDFRERMVKGMVDQDYPEEFARNCFSQIEGFGEYGFPESHAASFALLVYASCWLKMYYPDVFCAAMLNSQPMGFYAPSQLVRDAREHGVIVLPVDVNYSDWHCTLEPNGFDPRRIAPRHTSMRHLIRSRYAVRLGFRMVKGVSEKGLEALFDKRGQGYTSIRDLWLRTKLPRTALEHLADADAFRSIGLDRRAALWAVKALDTAAAAETLPLFAVASGESAGDFQAEPEMALPAMLPGEHVVEDYRATTLSLKAHPLSFLRDRLRRTGIITHETLETRRNGQTVSVAGLVLVRQRPGSAKGIIFMTLEDETGVANIIVWPKTFERYRAIVMGARLTKVTGKLQHANGVIHVVAEHVEDLTAELGLLQKHAKRFPTLNPGDEVGKTMPARGLKAPTKPMEISPETVMPKGRNFH